MTIRLPKSLANLTGNMDDYLVDKIISQFDLHHGCPKDSLFDWDHG